MALPGQSFARVLLFDRLVDRTPGQQYENPPLRMMGAADLQNSIGNELRRLFNTRSTTHGDGPLSMIDYGLPDWSTLHASNSEERKEIERGMQKAILAFEPRLRQPQVLVDPVAQHQQTLSIRLNGKLTSDDESWPVAFGIRIGTFGAEITLQDGIPHDQ